jgi:hypothetical protein
MRFSSRKKMQKLMVARHFWNLSRGMRAITLELRIYSSSIISFLRIVWMDCEKEGWKIIWRRMGFT